MMPSAPHQFKGRFATRGHWRPFEVLFWVAAFASYYLFPGKHLLLVRYNSHNPHEEWVYNGADLQAPKIVWAREMGDDINRRLLAHYADRHVWIVEPDAEGKQPAKIREALK